MRINCNVTVMNRSLHGSAMRFPVPLRSSLGVGQLSDGSTFIHLCTTTNTSGTRYKVQSNLQAVHTRFVDQGKFTVCFKDPTVNLIVNTDSVQAKTFINTLKDCLHGKLKVSLSDMKPIKASSLVKPKTTLTINSKKEYPITVGFPYNLEHLVVSGCELTRVERRMLKLSRLQTLNLSTNRITELPRAIAAVKCLTELILPSNRLDRLHPDIFDGNIANTLRKINFSNNMIEYLPRSFCLLRHLVTAELSSNSIRRLPFNLAKLGRLKYLLLSKNQLDSLPSSLRLAGLHELDISFNPFLISGCETDGVTELFSTRAAVPTLRELAARRCVDTRAPTAGLPVTLQSELRYAFVCQRCSKAAVAQTVVTVRRTSDQIYCYLAQSVLKTRVPHELELSLYCSYKCAAIKFQNGIIE